MVDIYSGMNNKVQVIEEDSFGSGTGTDASFGYIQSFEKKIDTHSEVVYALDGSPKPVTIVDGVMEITGSMEWLIASGEELKCIFGNYDGGTGTLSIANILPSYAIRDYEDSTTNHLLKGVKFERVSITASKNSFLSAKGDFLAKELVEDDTSITPSLPSTEPFFFHQGHLSIGGINYDAIDNITIEISRNTKAYRGIEQTAMGQQRLITNIVEGNLSIAFNGTMVIRKELYEQLMGGATLQDTRSDVGIVLTFSNGAKTLTITITGRLTVYDKKEDKEQDIVVADFSGVGLDITGSVS